MTSKTHASPSASRLLQFLRRRSLLREILSAMLCAVILLPPGYSPAYGSEDPPPTPSEPEFEPFENLEIVCEDKWATGGWSRLEVPGTPPSVGESGWVTFSDDTPPVYDLTSPAAVESARDAAFADLEWTERGYDPTPSWSTVPTLIRPKDEVPPETDSHRRENWLDVNPYAASSLLSFQVDDHSEYGSQFDSWQRSRHAVRFYLRRQEEIPGTALPVQEVKALMLHYRVIVSWTDVDGDDSSTPRELSRKLVAAKVYALQGGAEAAETYTYEAPTDLPPNCTAYDQVFLHGLCEFDVQPGEEAIVPADVGAIDLPTSFWSETEEHAEELARVVEVKVRWRVKEGGGSLSRETDTLTPDEPDSDTTLTFDSHDPGHLSRAEAEIEQITLGVPGRATSYETVTLSAKVETGPLLVAPGEVDEIGLGVTASSGHGSGASMPADGVSEREITAVLTDAFGNPVAEGVHVSWRLKGDGTFVSEETQTDVNGKARARLRAGRVPGLAQVVICEADLKRVEFPVANTALNVNLTPSAVAVLNYGSSQVRTFTVTAHAAAADGTPVRFQTTQGILYPEVTALSGGQATATVRVDYGSSSAPVLSGPLTVVRAAVAESVAITSAQMTTSMTTASGPLVAGGPPVTVTITAPPSLDGQSISVQPRALLTQQTVQDAAAIAAGTPPGVNYRFGDMDYRVSVAWTRPPAGTPFTGLDLLVSGGTRLAVDANGRPYVVVRTGGRAYVDERFDLPASATQTAPGESATIEFTSSAGGLLLGLAWQGESQRFVRSSTINNTLDTVPVASRPWVTEVVYARTAYSTQVPGGGPAGGVGFSGLGEGGFTTTSGGTVSFTVSVPVGFPYPVLEIRTMGSGSPVLHIPVSAAAPPPGTPPPPPPAGQVSAALSAQLQGIALDVVYDNRGATAPEQAEIARDAAKQAARAPEEAVPPAFGGGLAHQSSAGLNFQQWAKTLNTVTANIEAAANQANQVAVTDATGQQLFVMDASLSVREKVRTGGFGTWFSTKYDQLSTSIQNAATKGFHGAVRGFQSTMSWTHAALVATSLNEVPLFSDFDVLAVKLTDEGLEDFVKAMARLTASVAGNPQIAVGLALQGLEARIKPSLNQWGAANGEAGKVAAAGAGMIAFAIETGALMASTAADPGALRRMAAQMFGTVLSAAVGSEAAQNELKEMTPFWSWIVMGEQVADLWTGKKDDGSNATENGQPDYYGAGKKAGELVVQVIGDVTIIFPVVKGATLAIKAGASVSKKLVQALKKTGPGSFKREAREIADSDASNIIKRCRGIQCFPAGTLVLMASGVLLPIESIQTGDFVLADDPTDHEPPKAERVEDVVRNWTQRLFDIKTDRNGDEVCDAEFSSTGEHPFWTVERGWTAAKNLQSGDHLLAPDSSTVTVVANTSREHKSSTWNLTVAHAHAFYVVDAGSAVLVHNTNPGPKQFIVYVAPLKSDPNRFYVGIASMPSESKGASRPQDVLRYRAGPDGAEHHKAITGHIDGAKIQIRGSWWAEGKMDGKWIARGIEDHIHDFLVANDMHDPTQRKPISDGSKGPVNPLRTQYRNAGQNSELWKKVIQPSLPCP